MVSFHDNPEQYKSAAMLLQLDQEVRCQYICLLFLMLTITHTQNQKNFEKPLYFQLVQTLFIFQNIRVT